MAGYLEALCAQECIWASLKVHHSSTGSGLARLCVYVRVCVRERGRGRERERGREGERERKRERESVSV